MRSRKKRAAMMMVNWKDDDDDDETMVIEDGQWFWVCRGDVENWVRGPDKDYNPITVIENLSSSIIKANQVDSRAR